MVPFWDPLLLQREHTHCSQKGPYFRDRVPIGTFLTFWIPIYISRSLFSMFWLNSREECQFSLHVRNNEWTWSVQSKTIICSWKWSPFVKTGFVLHCWKILVFTSAYALNFKNHRFGSLFWLPRVPIGSLFHEKLGPYWVPISKHGGPYKFGEQWESRIMTLNQSRQKIMDHLDQRPCQGSILPLIEETCCTSCYQPSQFNQS